MNPQHSIILYLSGSQGRVMSQNSGSNGAFRQAYAWNRPSDFHFQHSLVGVMNTIHQLDRFIVVVAHPLRAPMQRTPLLHQFVALLVVQPRLPVRVRALAVASLPTNEHKALATMLTLRFCLLSHYVMISHFLFMSFSCVTQPRTIPHAWIYADLP